MPRSRRPRPRYHHRIIASSLCLLSLATFSGLANASITQRIASSFSQSRPSSSNSLSLATATTTRELEDAQYDDAAMANYDDDAVNAAMAERDEGAGDDGYLNMEDVDFGEVSIMPVSCVNYHNGHMIKFQFFEKSSSLNCHFKNLGTFVVSIAHYMRAYFNYQALNYGEDFSLPGDVGFLNCVMLKETANDEYPLYAKIGCQHRDTYTSTKLQLIVYSDKQCSQVYSDEEMRGDGYDVNGYYLSNKVSFRPPFYSCQGCNPEEVSVSFSKQYSAWYDDDYISNQGQKKQYDDDAQVEEEQNDDAAGDDDAAAAYYDDASGNAAAQTDDGSYYQQNDDTYNYAANYNDDGANAADDGNGHYVNNDDAVYYNYKAHDDDFYGFDDDRRRALRKVEDMDASHSMTAVETKKDYASDFQQEMALIHRQLEDQANDDGDNIAAWNMCQRVHKYGMWCDADCQALDTFRVDEWSRSDVFLLVIMCVFMGAMMLLVFAKRVKAYERAAMWGDEPGAPNPGLPPCAMLMLFAIVFTIIVVLAALKFVNETLVFAVVTCILLFIYMLKLTLFESRKQVFLPARSTRNHALKEPFY